MGSAVRVGRWEMGGKAAPVTLADTDGDQLSDRAEIYEHLRNPRIADLPDLGIEVGEISIQLDVRQTFTDQFGRETSTSRSTSTTLERSTASEWSTAMSASFSASLESTVGLEAGISEGTPSAKTSSGVTTNVGAEASFSTTMGGSRASNRAFSSSTELGRTDTATSTVERSVEGGRVRVTLTLNAQTDMAMTVRNLEVSLLQRDATDRSRYVAVATLLPATPALEVTLGPANPSRGPFVFQSDEVFPARVEELMRDPSALFVRVSNFDLVDELGRNFTFASQTVAERSGTIVIDYGDGVEERWSVALASTFDPDSGQAVGLTMEDALRVVGLTPWPGEDPDLESPDAPPADAAEVVDSYGMRTVDFGGPAPLQILTRVRDVQNRVDLADPGRTRTQGAFWALFSDDPGFEPTTDFTGVHFGPGATWTLAYVRDADGDGIYSLEEAGHRSSDQATDTDGDGLSDYLEIRGRDPQTQEQWRVYTDQRFGGYKAYSFPDEVDGDEDGLSDRQEYLLVPYEGGFPEDPFVSTPGHRGALDPRKRDTDDDGIIDGMERRFGGDPRTPDAQRLLDSDRDGLPNAKEQQGWETTVNGQVVTMRSNPEDPDTDNDGLFDYVEFQIGTDPSSDDTDGDGLLDQEEWDGWGRARWARVADDCGLIPNCTFAPPDRALVGSDPTDADTDGDDVSDGLEVSGWVVALYGEAQGRVISSDPLQPDTDGDGWSDGMEQAEGTNPQNADTDDDGLADSLEHTSCDDLGRCRQATRSDRRVRISHTSARMNVDWNNDVDWRWVIQVREPAEGHWLELSSAARYAAGPGAGRGLSVSSCGAFRIQAGYFEHFWSEEGPRFLSTTLVVGDDEDLRVAGTAGEVEWCEGDPAVIPAYRVLHRFGGQGDTGQLPSPLGNSDVVYSIDATRNGASQAGELGLRIELLDGVSPATPPQPAP